MRDSGAHETETTKHPLGFRLLDVCTIIAKNYLAAARVLAASLREHHPESRCHVLVVDGVDGYFDPGAEAFEVLQPEALELAAFGRMAGIYDVLELSTAVKPWLLRRLLRDADDGIVYLDPDVRLYAPITEVFDGVRRHGLVLNPHNTEPMPRDGLKPNEQDILIAGAYNLGIIGLGHSEFSNAFLDWWGERLETDCIVDPSRGFFVDQRWIDLVPGLAPDFHLIRDPAFNVAYWNLASRELSSRDGKYFVNGEPLRLFHFSGFKPASPHVLSRYQDRVRVADDPVLARLCREYADELLAAGHEEASAWPYDYAKTHSGIELDRFTRAVYRSAVADGDVSGSPFDEQGEQELLAWSNTPVARGGQHGVTRYLEVVYDRRPDLQAAYPDIGDPDIARGFLGWARVFGSEVPIPEVLLPAATPEHGKTAPGPLLRDRPLGVNVAGYLNAELGVGEVARQLIAALDTQRVPLLPVGLNAPNSRQGHDFAAPASIAAPFDINLICVNADGLPGFADQAGAGFFEGRYSIGVWWWELSEFPAAQVGAFDFLEEVWVGTTFIAQALQPVAPVPVIHMPLPVTAPAEIEPGREGFGIASDEFLFLFSFDFNSVFKRKNPLDLIEAFTSAFSPADGVRLVIKSINAERDRDNHDRLRIAAEPHAHVDLIDGYLSTEDNQRLLASCDAYVSLHRSEGFGIGMAEALLRGKPVVATAYGGNTDFLTEETGYPVSYSLVSVGEGAWPYDPAARWAQPDLEHAARQLRAVVESPEEAAARVRGAQAHLATVHSPVAVGERMRKRLETLHARSERWPSPPGLRLRLPRLEEAHQRTELGPSPAQGGRRLARRAARGALLRLMRPYTAHSDAVARDLVTAVREAADTSAQKAEERALDVSMAAAAALADARRLGKRVDQLDQRPAANGALDAATARRYRARTRMVDGSSGLSMMKDYPRAPGDEPWSHAYVAEHQRFVALELDDPLLLAAFRAGEQLPKDFGVGFDERVVEFPWVASRPLAGRVLDAGSTLNHSHVLLRLLPRMDELHVVTLAPEDESFPQLGVSYMYADLRDLPMKDGTYDRVVSISTLDQLGMDNARFGADQPPDQDPQAEAIRAVQELRRVLRPGGDLYLTVPVGRGERHGWVRSFTPEEVDELVEAFGPSEATTAFFRHDDKDGWRLAERDEITSARYRDHLSSGSVGSDRVVAAEAVACLALVRRS